VICNVPGTMVRALRGLGGRVLALCLVIFLSDVVYGFFVASYPVYARAAGMSLPAIGASTTAAALVQLAAAVPFGLLSDRFGRPGFIMAGVGAITLNMFFMAHAPGLWLLPFCPAVNGLAVSAVFQLGHAHMGDITTPEQRSLAFGLNSSAMALGFGLGPYAGGLVSDRWGYGVAYACVALVGCVCLLPAFYCHRTRPPVRHHDRVNPLAGVRLMIRRPDLRLVAFGNMLLGMTFAGILSTFLPLYGRELLLTQAAIGAMFVVRSFVSAAGRIVNGLLVRRLGSLSVMVVSLFFINIAVFGIGTTVRPGIMTSFLALEGLAYGGFMVAGLTYVADHTTPANRGAAGGVYAMTSALGGSIAPWFLGIVADRWGVRSVFFITGAVLAVGLLFFASRVSALKIVAIPAPLGEDDAPLSV
jgi:MFS transporter, DHA1 family, multidrug resistance protein